MDSVSTPPSMENGDSDLRIPVNRDFRRPPRPVHAPAIVRHLCYWIEGVSRDERRELFLALCNELIGQSRFKNETPLPGSKAYPDEPRRKHHTCLLKCKNWRGLEVYLTVELHQEYLAIYQLIELGRFLKGELVRSNPLFITDLKQSIASVNATLSKRQRDLEAGLAPGSRPTMRDVRKDLSGQYEDIFLNTWEMLHSELLSASLQKIGAGPDSNFADFRGLIVGAGDGEFFRFDIDQTPRADLPKTFPLKDCILKAHVVLPFMTADVKPSTYVEEKELTVSRLLGSRCIYASTLGVQFPTDAPKRRKPLTYFVLASAISSWQAGRLVDSIHRLGSTRIAARRDLDKLSNAGTKLREVERDLEKIDEPGPDVMFHSGKGERANRQLETAFDDLRKAKSMVPGGLPYRVERSRYYRSQFKTLLSSLRLESDGRIEGFQPYHEFVENRFGSIYEFIDMVGIRFDRIERQLSVLYQRHLQQETTEQTRKIEHFQGIAEKGFFIVLFPYYVSVTLAHLLLPLLLWLIPDISELRDPNAESILQGTLALLSIIMGPAILLFMAKMRRNRKESNSRKRNK